MCRDLDDPDNWSRDYPDYKPHCYTLNGEDYTLNIDIVSADGIDALPAAGPPSMMIGLDNRPCTCLPHTASGQMLVAPNCPHHKAPAVTFSVQASPAAGRETRYGVYIASKTKHAQRWKDLRASGVPIVSTWIDEAGEGETKSYADLWSRCIREAMTAERFIIYAEPGEVLKGALVEMGAAIAAGVPVFSVGEIGKPLWESVLTTKCATVEQAIRARDGGEKAFIDGYCAVRNL